jgi:predicted phosphodiesterase
MRSVVRRGAEFAAAAVVGVVGALAGMTLWAKSSVSMGPFQVLLASRFGKGVTVIALPPFGRLTADTHFALLRFTATLQSVRVNELTGIIRSGGAERLVDQVQVDALHQVVPFAVRLILVSLAGGLILSLLAFRTRWRSVAIGVLAAILAVGGSEVLAWQTYRPGALLTPSFSGSLALAPKLIGPARTAIDRIDNFRAELSRIVGGAVRLYTQVQGGASPTGNEIKILHISDIHDSPLGLAFAKEVADAFDVDFVIDTGDLTSFGTALEGGLILSGVADVRRPYVFVRGNHDSISLQSDLRRAPNAIVLDGQTIRVKGITIYGVGDPVFTPNRLALLDDAEFVRRIRAAGEPLLASVRAMPKPPDIVAVHDDRMAEAAAGYVPLVISGHFHQASARTIDQTLFLRVGSTGGAGANVFTRVGGIPLSAEVLYLSQEVPHRLVAFDVIEQLPESGTLAVRRHLVEEQFGTLVPTPPSPSPSSSSPAPESPSLTPTQSPSI